MENSFDTWLPAERIPQGSLRVDDMQAVDDLLRWCSEIYEQRVTSLVAERLGSLPSDTLVNGEELVWMANCFLQKGEIAQMHGITTNSRLILE